MVTAMIDDIRIPVIVTDKAGTSAMRGVMHANTHGIASALLTVAIDTSGVIIVIIGIIAITGITTDPIETVVITVIIAGIVTPTAGVITRMDTWH